MAEDAVSRELFSAKFPANRGKYREICALHRTALEISADKEVPWPEKLRACDQSEQGSIRERRFLVTGFFGDLMAPILR